MGRWDTPDAEKMGLIAFLFTTDFGAPMSTRNPGFVNYSASKAQDLQDTLVTYFLRSCMAFFLFGRRGVRALWCRPCSEGRVKKHRPENG